MEKIEELVIDHESRIKELEKAVPKLEIKMENMAGSLIDLKNLSVSQHKEAMELFRNVIQHNQTMDQLEQQFKQEMAKFELGMKEKQMEADEKHRSEKDAWERQQKEENAKLKRDLITKVIAWGTPIVTVVVTVIVKMIEAFTL
jgi:biopolymer transport protein ExbB/TolQ